MAVKRRRDTHGRPKVVKHVTRSSETGRYVRGPSSSAVGGAVFGGLMGSAFGPIGAAAGMVIGGIAGEAVVRHYANGRGVADTDADP